MDRRSFVMTALGRLACTGACTGVAQADEMRPLVIQLEPDPSFPNGTMSEFSAFSDQKGPILALNALSIFQPVRVALIADDAANLFNLRIAHPTGNGVIFDQPTGPSGSVTARFRAQGDIRIIVTSSTGRNRFSMIVWAGDTVSPKPQSVLRPIP